MRTVYTYSPEEDHGRVYLVSVPEGIDFKPFVFKTMKGVRIVCDTKDHTFISAMDKDSELSFATVNRMEALAYLASGELPDHLEQVRLIREQGKESPYE